MFKPVDITGKKFNQLTAVEFNHKKNTRHFWLFKCDCGGYKIASKSEVIKGGTKTCGCWKKTIKSGDKINRLTAVKFLKKIKSRTIWLFSCDCGSSLEVEASRVLSGNTKSCGCLKLELFKKRFTTHGHTKDLEFSGTYKAWRAMKDRCARQKEYKDIYISDDWSNFDNFYRDMGDRPEGKTLDRIDNSKGYERDNCRWATRQEQIRNTGYRKRKAGTKYKGVSKTKYNRYRVSICVNYKKIHLGCFKTELEAAKAYNEAAKKYFGEFAQLNDV